MGARMRDSTALAVGSLASGVLAYVFFAVATRGLGPAAAAPVSILWTYWSFTAAAITFPIQHWMARTAVVDGEGYVRAAIPQISQLVLAVSAVVTVLAWWGRHALFDGRGVWFPLLVGGVTIGSGLVGAVRGGLVVRHRFTALSWALAAENAARCVAAIGLAVAQIRAAAAYGLALVAGALTCLWWVSALRFEPTPTATRSTSPIRLLSGSAGGSLLGQTVLTGGPVVLALSGGSAAQTTSMFAGLALFRAPYIVALGLVSQLTGRLSAWVLAENWTLLARLRTWLIVVTVASTAAGAAVGAWLGPPLLQWIFGDGVVLSASQCGLIAAGSVLALANLVVSVALIAHSRAASVAGVWCIGIAVAVVYFVLTDAASLQRVCVGFLVAEAVAFVAGVGQDWRQSPRGPR